MVIVSSDTQMFINECAPISRALVTLIEEKGRFQQQNAGKLAAVRRLRVRETRRQHKLSAGIHQFHKKDSETEEKWRNNMPET